MSEILNQAQVIRRAGQTPCVACCDYPATRKNAAGDDVCDGCKDI